MNKVEMVNAISIKADCTKKDAAKYLDAVVETITETLAKGEKISLVGFGSFEVVDREARTGRNPQTGETIEIPASKSPKFKAGSKLKEIVNA